MESRLDLCAALSSSVTPDPPSWGFYFQVRVPGPRSATNRLAGSFVSFGYIFRRIEW
jgi:hypothetical protein